MLMLLDRGADVNAVNTDGKTAMSLTTNTTIQDALGGFRFPIDNDSLPHNITVPSDNTTCSNSDDCSSMHQLSPEAL